MNARHYIAGLVAGIVVTLSAVALTNASAPPVPRLIAHDCEGSGGDLFAMDVRDFPAGCGLVEVNR